MTPAELNDLPSPQFWRRVFCGLYEQLVLLGVIAFTFLLPNLGLGILFGVSLPSWLTFLYLYLVLGFYFVWYWTKSGQTLAMQTWRVRMIDKSGFTLNRRQAIWRYIFGSLWIIPCVALQAIFHLEKWQIVEMLFAVALFIWPLSIYLDRKDPKERQGLPDRFAGTRLVELPKNLVTLT
ncbi:RDD family protein [Polynucleobacter sp. 15G-AUS-farblos]|uniref:RDD family protein n=1 Tax=Polynucleobacter sp. 15G-AUS-farblos TaxID=2689094 RepID=UPI001C0D0F16|nr:RDD family protein [Polynucleobacter sp. 15G-AUS-farblos]MBU3584389.1 RDD family protein [Polynucleobacter sp. 15G-AUS-farblos]